MNIVPVPRSRLTYDPMPPLHVLVVVRADAGFYDCGLEALEVCPLEGADLEHLLRIVYGMVLSMVLRALVMMVSRVALDSTSGMVYECGLGRGVFVFAAADVVLEVIPVDMLRWW